MEERGHIPADDQQSRVPPNAFLKVSSLCSYLALLVASRPVLWAASSSWAR